MNYVQARKNEIEREKINQNKSKKKKEKRMELKIFKKLPSILAGESCYIICTL